MRQLAKAERRIVLGGRTPERDIVLPRAAANLPVTRPITGPDRWLDHRAEEARPARTQDLLDWTQVIEQLPHLDFTGLILTHDLPPYSRDVAGTALMLQHTTKHVHTDPHSAEAARLVMDDEWLASVKRIMQGMAVDAERLAVDVFREVGPRGQFLATDHTARHCRSLYLPGSLRDRQSRPAWEASGRPSLRKAARERLESLLLAPPPEPLPPEVVAELDRIVRHAAQTLDRVES
jgi:trimethylamine--corrinoid protein Co-methyltransferase